MPYQHALSQHRSKIVFHAVFPRGTAQNSDPGGKEAEVITSYFHIPRRWAARRLEQHPRRARPF